MNKVETDQRLTALERANRVRFRNAQTKRELKAKPRPEALPAAAQLLIQPTPELGRMTVFKFLNALPGIGQVKAHRLTVAAQTRPSTRLDELSARQRQVLAGQLVERGKRAT